MKDRWTYKPSEVDSGDHYFDGVPYITQGVSQKLTHEEIMDIIADLQKEAKKHNGIDYLQVYKNSSDDQIWIINQLPREIIETCDPKWVAEHNFFTVLLPEEY